MKFFSFLHPLFSHTAEQTVRVAHVMSETKSDLWCDEVLPMCDWPLPSQLASDDTMSVAALPPVRIVDERHFEEFLLNGGLTDLFSMSANEPFGASNAQFETCWHDAVCRLNEQHGDKKKPLHDSVPELCTESSDGAFAQNQTQTLTCVRTESMSSDASESVGRNRPRRAVALRTPTVSESDIDDYFEFMLGDVIASADGERDTVRVRKPRRVVKGGSSSPKRKRFVTPPPPQPQEEHVSLLECSGTDCSCQQLPSDEPKGKKRKEWRKNPIVLMWKEYNKCK